MKATQHISEITFAVEGARGPPDSKKANLFLIQRIPAIIIDSRPWGSIMYQPKPIRSGFKTPPVANSNGRGPPMKEKREFFVAAFAD